MRICKELKKKILEIIRSIYYKTHIYIDLENVHWKGLVGIDEYGKSTCVHILYSDNARTLDMQVVEQLKECKCDIEFVKILASGRDALDAQLISMLSVNAGNIKSGTHIVISKDKGYTGAILYLKKYFKDRSVSFYQFPSLTVCPVLLKEE